MKHYNSEEWKLFAVEAIDEAKRTVMEEHLYQCDECMECYLSIIDASTDTIVDSLISPDFTDNIMKLIEVEKVKEKEGLHGLTIKEKQVKNNKISRNSILKYYTIAACITIVLFHMGIFDLIGETVPRAAEELADSTKRVELVAVTSWTDRLMETTGQFLDILSKNRRSDFDEKK